MTDAEHLTSPSPDSLPPGARDSLILVGAPGSGKTTVGRVLAARLGRRHIDVDQIIETAAGQPIAEIFIDHGEAHFRALEREHTLAALTGDGVISLGGGAVGQVAVREALARRPVVWLDVSAAEAAARVGLNSARPLLLGNVRGTLARLLKERAVLYQEVASVRVVTTGRTPVEVADEIVAWFGSSPPAAPASLDGPDAW